MRTATSLGSGYVGGEFTFKPIQVRLGKIMEWTNATVSRGQDLFGFFPESQRKAIRLAKQCDGKESCRASPKCCIGFSPRVTSFETAFNRHQRKAHSRLSFYPNLLVFNSHAIELPPQFRISRRCRWKIQRMSPSQSRMESS